MTNTKKIIFFLASAGITGLIYIGILFLFQNILKANNILSVSVAYGAAMIFYFITNKTVVFKNKDKSQTKRQAVQFSVVVVVNYFITLLIVSGVQHFTHEIYSGSVVAGIVTTLLAYFLFEKLIFKQ